MGVFFDNLAKILQRHPVAFADRSQVWNPDETPTTTLQQQKEENKQIWSPVLREANCLNLLFY